LLEIGHKIGIGTFSLSGLLHKGRHFPALSVAKKAKKNRRQQQQDCSNFFKFK
jgi:hypothetical protein